MKKGIIMIGGGRSNGGCGRGNGGCGWDKGCWGLMGTMESWRLYMAVGCESSMERRKLYTCVSSCSRLQFTQNTCCRDNVTRSHESMNESRLRPITTRFLWLWYANRLSELFLLPTSLKQIH